MLCPVVTDGVLNIIPDDGTASIGLELEIGLVEQLVVLNMLVAMVWDGMLVYGIVIGIFMLLILICKGLK